MSTLLYMVSNYAPVDQLDPELLSTAIVQSSQTDSHFINSIT